MTRPLVYLSGPIANCSEEEIHGWRNEFKKLYGEQNCTDPADHVYEDVDDNWTLADIIVENDLADIEDVQVHLMYYTRPTCGTLMETVHARYMNKFIIVVCPDDEVYNKLSPWVIYHSDHIVKTFEEAINIIEDVYARENII